MRANRKDLNHNEIEALFRSYGFVTLDISDKKNCCDIVVQKNNFAAMVEIKSGPSKKLTPGEIKFRDYWVTAGLWFRVNNPDGVAHINYLAYLEEQGK